MRGFGDSDFGGGSRFCAVVEGRADRGVGGDAWFSEEKLEDEGTYTAWGIKHGKETSLASLLAAHTGAKLAGDSPFEVGALAA